MRNQLFILLLMFLSCINSKGAETIKALVLELKNGEIITYALSEAPELSIKNESIIISSSKVNNEFARTSIKEFRFEEFANSIDLITDKEIKILKMDESEIIIDCGNGIYNFEVFDIDGYKMKSITRTNNEFTKVDISSLSKGIYVIRINENRTFKFIKK